MSFTLKTLDHIALPVKNAERSVTWYSSVLGLRKETRTEWGPFPILMLSADGTGLALFQMPEGNPLSPTTNRPHIAFAVSFSEFKNVQSHLGDIQQEFTFEDHTSSKSIYMRDPDAYYIEVTTYIEN